jgi:hypothetical protein
MKVGKDSVVMGDVSGRSDVGDRSVVIGPTDTRGNTILNKSMAVGHGAKAGEGSVAMVPAQMPASLRKRPYLGISVRSE